jgi:hypothetical protein
LKNKGKLNQTPTVSHHSYFTVAVMTPQQDITFTMVGGGGFYNNKAVDGNIAQVVLTLLYGSQPDISRKI